MHPKWLLLAPPAVWSMIGLSALLLPDHFRALFPAFWLANDIALVTALFGLLLWAFRGPGPVGPPEAREWDVRPPPELAAMPVEGVLRILAARARRER
ncbi:MAG TPA: hypothetical protein VGB42_08095 [Candidatus Thermoplasmatota archaeon]